VTEPDAPEPDGKDWTWTLHRRCPECGFDATATSPRDAPEIVDDVVERFVHRLADPDAVVRPEPRTWSTTEYACHVRDVCDVFDGRLRAMLTEDDPLFANWDQDRTAREQRYWRQQPERVGAELAAAGSRINATIRGVPDEERGRPGRRSNGSVFTVTTLIQYFAHDLVHHAHDIRRRPAAHQRAGT
jgi:hypothetical protein